MLPAVTLLPTIATAQCQPTWTAFSLDNPRRGNGAFELGVHDEDGDGPLPPALYAGNLDLRVGDVRSHIGRFDGWAWSTVPDLNASSMVFELLSVPDGPAPRLRGMFAGGTMQYSGNRRLSPGIARFNGEAWRDVDGGAYTTLSLLMHDEDDPQGSPARLFLGGDFRSAGGDPSIFAIARWDGTEFTSVGGGVRDDSQHVDALAVFDEDGPGPLAPALFVGGSFYYAGPILARDIARWDGQRWSNVGPPGAGTDGDVHALCVYDEDGPGPRLPVLFVGGTFSHIVWSGENLPISGLARWDGQNWSAVPGFNGGTRSMAVFDDDGAGPNRESLFVSAIGLSIHGIPANGIARWDGQQWHTLAGGLSGYGVATHSSDLCVFDEDGEGPNPGGLWCCGFFAFANGVHSIGLARWGCPLPPRCYADCDQSTGPGVIDALDFLCFMQRFEAADPSACDCDASTGPRVCDIFDFLCFQNRYAEGCP